MILETNTMGNDVNQKKMTNLFVSMAVAMGLASGAVRSLSGDTNSTML